MPKIKKKQSKIRQLGCLLKPNSFKKALLLFAAVFALAGGAYTVYKSRAANWSQGPSSFRLVFGYWLNGKDNTGVLDDHSDNGGCKVNKSCPYVTQLFAASQIETTVFTHFSYETHVHFCITARAPYLKSTKTGTDGDLHTQVNGGINVPVDTPFYYAQSYVYGKYCHGMSIPPGNQNVDVKVTSQPNNTNSSYNLYIAAISMEW